MPRFYQYKPFSWCLYVAFELVSWHSCTPLELMRLEYIKIPYCKCIRFMLIKVLECRGNIDISFHFFVKFEVFASALGLCNTTVINFISPSWFDGEEKMLRYFFWWWWYILICWFYLWCSHDRNYGWYILAVILYLLLKLSFFKSLDHSEATKKILKIVLIFLADVRNRQVDSFICYFFIV